MGFDALARLSEEEGKCWAFGESRRVVPAEVAREVVSAIQAERDDLAARLAELEVQEPAAWMTAKRDMASLINFHDDDLPLFARPVPAEPVNVDFGMRGENMFFQIGNQSFLLDYKPEEQGEFEFMKAMLLSAFSRITHGVKTESQPVNARILDVSTGKLEHINAGLCPDSINGPDSRDPACPACRAIAEADADLKLENILHKFGEADFPPGYCLDPMCSREEMEAQQEKPKD
ncbi:MAG TPA: hypothetical protein P5169_07335 [Kiritimatiellia bacterium]|nr:hypothetical protein [Kiritimatiellia bacterium]